MEYWQLASPWPEMHRAPRWHYPHGYVLHYAGEVPNNKEVVSLLLQNGGLDAHLRLANGMR
jgi:hypothetical protein